MCGIAGIFSFSGNANEIEVRKMTDTLIHRGPDGEGVWKNPTSHVCLGHRRLSIIDLSESGNQPMHFADGRYTITYNGEIYNYLELKEELQKKGYRFVSTSDTEVLLALYDLKKEKCLAELDGMFAFAIWDERDKTLFCARDRFGEKPFYYHFSKNSFVFASEMKALFALGIEKKQNKKKIHNFLLYLSIEDALNRSSTFYENIFQLEPSHYLIINLDRKIIKKKYWDIDIRSRRSDVTEAQAANKFRELLTLSVSRRLRSDVPVGSSLSGGLDSSTIVLMIDKMKRESRVQKTFSARFKNFERDEGRFMQMVIDKANVEPHFVFPTAESAMKNFAAIVRHQEEPFGSASIVAQFEVMKLSSDNQIRVLLDGQGADEILAGYPNYLETYFSQLYRMNPGRYREEKAARLNLYGELPFLNDFRFKWRSLHLPSYKYFAAVRKKMASFSSDYFLGIHPDLVATFHDAPNPIAQHGTLKEHLYWSLMAHGLDELLRFADRNAMANSVEVRLPFLFHSLVEFAFTLPDEMLLKNGWTKYLLRKSMENILPSGIAWRKDKVGYEPPEAEWLKTKYFQEYFQESVAELKKEKIIIKEHPKLTWRYISLFAFSHNR
jgi:asparagine synthase (glutamine-hydrolysing)